MHAIEYFQGFFLLLLFIFKFKTLFLTHKFTLSVDKLKFARIYSLAQLSFSYIYIYMCVSC